MKFNSGRFFLFLGGCGWEVFHLSLEICHNDSGYSVGVQYKRIFTAKTIRSRMFKFGTVNLTVWLGFTKKIKKIDFLKGCLYPCTH